LSPYGDVLAHGHVRPDRVALEDHPHVAALGRQHAARLRDDLAVGADAPAVGLEESRDHAKRGGLAAARGTEQADELARLDRQVDAVDRRHARIAFRKGFEL
jgi:hypothetical protein